MFKHCKHTAKWNRETQLIHHIPKCIFHDKHSPQDAQADLASCGEPAEPKPLFTLNVRQHKGKVLSNLIPRRPEIQHQYNTSSLV